MSFPSSVSGYKLAAAALSLALLVLHPPQLSAQIDTGRIVGTVQDQSGAVIPGASVTLTNEGNGLVLRTATSGTGAYVFPALKVATYVLEVQAPGFQTFSRPGLPVHVQQDLTVDVTLATGQVTETTTVTAAAPLLQAESASLGQTVGERQVNDLPLNGRNWTLLAQLSPGAVAATSGPLQTFSANGVTSMQNDFRLNGINNNNEMYNYKSLYSVLPPPDAVQEFKVETGNYSAEFGHSAGSVVNATLKSGTNQVHGSLWEFLRNDKLDAAQFFENAYRLGKGAFRQNQFGGTIGGPVILPSYNGKNKTFFFFDYQGTRIRQAVPFTGTVPTASMRNSGYTNLQDLISYNSGTRTDLLGRTFALGTVFDPATTRSVTAGSLDPITGLQATQAGLVRDPFYAGSLMGVKNFTSPAVKALLNLLPAGRLDANAVTLLNLYPAANGAGFFNNYANNSSQADDTNQFDLRIDHNFSGRDQLFGVISWSHELINYPDTLPGLANGGVFASGITDLPHQNIALSYTHLFSPTVLNEARLGYNRSVGNSGSFEQNRLGIPAQYAIQGIPQVPNNGGLPLFSIAGLTQLGVSGYLPTLSVTQSKEFSDNLSKVHGGHTFKGGVLIDLIRGGSTQPAYGRGYFTYSGTYTDVPYQTGGSTGLAQLLLTPIGSLVPGGYDNVGGANAVSASDFANSDDIRAYYGVYFQDDWKVTPRLTLNLGLRWDYFTPNREKYGAAANFIPGAPGNGARYLIPDSRCREPRSASFDALTSKDGISVECTSNASLGNAQKGNFAPRFGFAYRLTPRLVVRGGYGMSYGALANIGYGNNPEVNYPFVYTFNVVSPDAAHPITFSNGSIATFENGLSGLPLAPVDIKAQNLTLVGRQYDFKTPYYQSFNFTTQYQLSANQTLQVAYVGTLGRHLDTFVRVNVPTVLLPPGVNPQSYVPFPDFARNSPYQATAATSHYNGLQANFERRFSAGLSLLANYTFSKCLSDYKGKDNTVGAYRASVLAGFGIQGDYGLCPADVTQVAHSAASWELPVGRGKPILRNSGRLLNGAAGGWKINYILALQGGQPFTVPCPVATTSDFGCFAFLAPGQNLYAGAHTVDHWLNPAAFAQPPTAKTIGQTDFSPLGGAPTQARGPGIRRMDFSIFKEFPVQERAHLEVRVEVFNLTNTPAFGQPSYLDFTNKSTFGRITSLRFGANDPREIQLAMKMYW